MHMINNGKRFIVPEQYCFSVTAEKLSYFQQTDVGRQSLFVIVFVLMYAMDGSVIKIIHGTLMHL